MWVGTFHAIGARMLRATPHLVGRTPSFTIYDQDDSLGVIKRADGAPRHLAEAVHAARRFSRRSPTRRTRSSRRREYAAARDGSVREGRVAPSIDELGEALRRANAVDFDDLLVLPVRMLAAESGRARAATASASSYILVDEYQDTNRAQYEFIKLLGGEHGNVCVVGDDDQSIYGWRGADIRNILDFKQGLSDAATSCGSRRTTARRRRSSTSRTSSSARTRAHGQDAARDASRRRARHASCAALDERDEADFVVERDRSRVARSRRR